MRVIVGSRRSGKTRALVEHLRAHPKAVLVVSCDAERRRIFSLCPEAADSRQVVTFEEARLGRLSGRSGEVIVDDAGAAIERALRLSPGQFLSTIAVEAESFTLTNAAHGLEIGG